MDKQNLFEQGISKVKTTISSLSLEQRDFMKAFVRMCSDGWAQGWHERNGGNASYRMSVSEVASCRSCFYDECRPWISLGVQLPELAGEYFLVTGAGSFMSAVAHDISATLGIVELDGSGAAYRVVWGLEEGGKPTSEFASHCMVHAVKKDASNDESRVLYHAHPTQIIALTCALPLDSREITRVLWKTMTECIIVFPEGVGVVPCAVPGSLALAEKTAHLMLFHNAVIWAHHGLFVSGKTCDDAFGLAHVIVKAADIYGKSCVLCGGSRFRQSISDDDLRSIVSELNLTVNASWLN